VARPTRSLPESESYDMGPGYLGFWATLGCRICKKHNVCSVYWSGPGMRHLHCGDCGKVWPDPIGCVVIEVEVCGE
jgi:hypothetical protein